MDWSEIHYEKDPAWALRPLAFFSFLYGLGVRLRARACAGKARRSLPGFVVSIGNITAGGTGKTPAVMMLAKWAREEGYHVAILTRGYRGRHREKVLEVGEGAGRRITPALAGDEPFLLSRNLKGIPVMISRDRHRAGCLAHEKYRTNFYILDDGFQHTDLKRDVDLVLLDASNPFGNGRLLPLGPLREPRAHLVRADAFILTRCGTIGSRAVPGFLEREFPGKPVFRSDHVPEGVVFPVKGGVNGPESLRGKRVIAFAGIARPAYFRETLERLGAKILLFKAFRDHYPYRIEELKGFIDEKKRQKVDLIITTEKDWVRIDHLGIGETELAYLTVRFKLLEEKPFFDMIRERMEREGGLAGRNG
ncbi:MAG: tetraacyldisaccharide 4'-kinase [Deltaproteobacteria bacterium]|nr:tetraacyldisaccharide 4'-kinase [Deltaproteobacteria bacterium]